MTKYVRETSAGKSISAYIVLNKKGEEVALIQSYCDNSGRCLVNVFASGGDRVHARNAAAYAERYGKPPREPLYFQFGTAGGYGYDKFSAAISGMVIDGIVINDHCGTNKKTEKLFREYLKACDELGPVEYGGEFQTAWNKKAARLGARFANWDREKSRFSSLYLESNLNRLTALGYRIIQAI